MFFLPIYLHPYHTADFKSFEAFFSISSSTASKPVTLSSLFYWHPHPLFLSPASIKKKKIQQPTMQTNKISIKDNRNRLDNLECMKQAHVHCKLHTQQTKMHLDYNHKNYEAFTQTLGEVCLLDVYLFIFIDNIL